MFKARKHPTPPAFPPVANHSQTLSASYGRTIRAGLAGLVGIVALLALSLTNEYREADQHAEQEVENISRLLEEHALATVRKSDLLLREAQRNVRPADMRPSGHENRRRVQELHALLKSQLASVPEVAVIHITDATGDHIYSSLDALPHVNIADRYHFMHHRNDAAAELVMSPPLVSRTTGKWTIVLTRRLNFEDGGFAGTVNVILDLEYFQQFYRTLNLGAHGVVALYDKQFHLAARIPPSEKEMGKSVQIGVRAYIEKGAKHGVYHATSPVDNIERMLSFRQVDDLPLVVFAGIARNDYLTEWRRHAWQYGIGIALLILVMMGFGLRQRRAEKQLHQASLYARSLIEASLDPLVTISADGKIMDVNSATENATGRMRDKLIGSDFSDYFTEPEKARTGYEQVFSRGQVTDYPLAIRHTSGEIAEVLYNASLYRDAQGKVAGVFAAARDITGRKEAEQKLRRLSQLYATLSQCNEAIMHCANETELFTHVCRDLVHFGGMEMAWVGLVERGSPRVAVVASYGDRLNYLEDIVISVDGEDPHGRGPTGTAIRENRPYWCQDFLHDPATAPWHQRAGISGWGASASLPLLRNGVPVGAITLYAGKVDSFDEESRQLLIKMAGNISYALENFDHEAKRRKAEETLRELNETLEQRVEEEATKNREKDLLLIQQSRLAAMGEMIGNIAHQWRQPINALTLLLANIKDAYEYHELDQEFLESEVATGQDLIQKMSHTIDDFRNFFRPNKEKQRFIACDSVEEALKLVGSSFRSNGIEIAQVLCDEPCAVIGYPNEFAQVVLNVLTNAKEAIAGKRASGQVHICIDRTSDTAIVSIRDNGGGIPEEILPKVFDPYFTTKEKGTGIGLYMSKMIMDNMGGNIAVRNTGDGAEVLLTLTLAPAATV